MKYILNEFVFCNVEKTIKERESVVELTLMESEILEIILERRGLPIKLSQLVEIYYGDISDDDVWSKPNVVMNVIFKLRSKSAFLKRNLINVCKRGYKINSIETMVVEENKENTVNTFVVNKDARELKQFFTDLASKYSKAKVIVRYAIVE